MSVKQYFERPKTIEAIQFTGYINNIRDIQMFIGVKSMSVDFSDMNVDGSLSLLINGNIARTGDYIVNSFEKGTIIVRKNEFESKYSA